MTPRCQPSPSTTSRRSAASSASVSEAGFNRGERGGLGVAALAVQAFELGGQFAARAAIAGVEELDDLGGHVHAAGGVDARRQAEGDVEAGELLWRRDRARRRQRARAGPRRRAGAARAVRARR